MRNFLCVSLGVLVSLLAGPGSLPARADAPVGAPSFNDAIKRIVGFLGAPSSGTQLSGSVSASGSGPCGYTFSLTNLGNGESQARVKLDAGRTRPEGTFEHLTTDFGTTTGAQVLGFTESPSRLHLAVRYVEEDVLQGGQVLESHPMLIMLDLEHLSSGRIQARLEKRSASNWDWGFNVVCSLPGP
jgi:hypothetical protein